MQHLSVPPNNMPPECSRYGPCACRSCQTYYLALPSSYTLSSPYPTCYQVPEIPVPIPQLGFHPSLPIMTGLPNPTSIYQTDAFSLLPEASNFAPSWAYRNTPKGASSVPPSWAYRTTSKFAPSVIPCPSLPISPSYSFSSTVSAIGGSCHSTTEFSETCGLALSISGMAEEANSPATQERADMKTAQELADLEKLSAQYEPDVNGPLVGELQSSKILEAEYAGADQAYVRKTAALSPKYSNYRTIRGDGNCGWRALAFGYFELLLRTGDSSVIEAELARMTSLCSLLDSVGMSSYLYEDFVDETKKLLETVSKSPTIDNPYDDKVLVEAFNQDDISNAIITHLKLLTSAYMKVNPDGYEPFLIEHPTIAEYTGAQIEPYGVQIDHLGVKALIDVLFIPAGLNVEISYLDRSDSDEVNVHKFEDESKPASSDDKAAQTQKTLRMLYRPGHYDLIYKNGDLAPANLPTSGESSSGSGNIRVSMMLGEEYTQNPFLSSNFSASISPGIIDLDNHNCGQCYPTMRAYRSHDGSVVKVQKINHIDHHEVKDQEEEPPLQTKMFKNSHYNTRHFQNEHFQPEMWHPGSEGGPKSSGEMVWRKVTF